MEEESGSNTVVVEISPEEGESGSSMVVEET